MNKQLTTLILIIIGSICLIPTILIFQNRSYASNLMGSSNLLAEKMENKSPQAVLDKQEKYRYKYADGAGNLYIINLDSINYLPVTKATSSSLNYSGGKPRVVKINTRQYREIALKLERGLNLRSIRAVNDLNGRAKGTGIISKRDRDRQVRSRVLAMNSSDRQEIETLLKQLIGDSLP